MLLYIHLPLLDDLSENDLLWSDRLITAAADAYLAGREAGPPPDEVQERKTLKRKQVLRFWYPSKPQYAPPNAQKKDPMIYLYMPIHHRTILSGRAKVPRP